MESVSINTFVGKQVYDGLRLAYKLKLSSIPISYVAEGVKYWAVLIDSTLYFWKE